MFLSDISIRRPVFATMMMVTLVVLGIVAYKRLSLDEYPDVTYPVIIVQTSYPGTSPEVMERQISRPIEQAVNTVQGIYEVSSTSLEGISIVRLQFNLGVDVAVAQQDVQAKVARIRRTGAPYEYILIEGSGGLLVPLGAGFDVRDLIAARGRYRGVRAPGWGLTLAAVRYAPGTLPPERGAG